MNLDTFWYQVVPRDYNTAWVELGQASGVCLAQGWELPEVAHRVSSPERSGALGNSLHPLCVEIGTCLRMYADQESTVICDLNFSLANMILNCDLIKFLSVSQCASGIHRWNHPVLCLWKCSLPNIVLGCDSMKHLWPIRSQQALQVCCQPLRLHGIHKLSPKRK